MLALVGARYFMKSPHTLSYAPPEHRPQRDVWRLAMLCVTAILAFVISAQWGLAMFWWPISVLSDVGEPEAHIIRRVMPHHIINPDWLTVAPSGDLINQWLFDETLVRLLVIWGLWAGIVAVIIRWRKKHGKIGDASDNPHF
jgi:hypothetical protein